MSYVDLQPALENWRYDSDRISVRKILGQGNEVKIQVRVELGVLQMEVDGRPDAEKPFGNASLLEYHRTQLADHLRRNATPLGFALTPSQCEALRYEASLYYRRFVALFVLDEFNEAARDVSHHTGILDLCRDYALERDDRERLEVFRPYVLMMNARARAEQASADSDVACALAHINRGMLHIRTYLEENGPPEAVEQCEELTLLEDIRQGLVADLPVDSVVTTHRALRSAIEHERYEEAARLRDWLNAHYETARSTTQ